MPHAIDPRTLGLVVAGGAAGVLARAAIVVPLGDAVAVPWVTLAINVLGSFLLGVAAAMLGTDFPRWHAFVGTGMLGGFTTYSAFAVEVVQFSATPWTAVGLVAASLLGGVVAAYGGLHAGRLMRPAAAREVEVPE